ncbi:MAG: hypothetical protein Q8L69_14485 [Gallionellaceae bacterium]|nr:hypothetical protein [Gallionellaceae bacterium]
MFNKLGLAALLLVMALPQASWGKAGCDLKEADKGKETVTQELHPAGPTTRREWRSSQAEQPHRIQYERIRSGHVLVGKARLVRDKNGIWYVESSCNKRIQLLGGNEEKTKTVKTFTEERQVWKVCVTRQDIPLTQPGVATESEPSLELVLVRQQK